MFKRKKEPIPLDLIQLGQFFNKKASRIESATSRWIVRNADDHSANFAFSIIITIIVIIIIIIITIIITIIIIIIIIIKLSRLEVNSRRNYQIINKQTQKFS